MEQSAVNLRLERIREFWVRLFVINERPESTLNAILERDHERVTRNSVGAAVEKELHQRSSHVSSTASNWTA